MDSRFYKIAVGLVLFLVGCGSSTLDPVAYMSYCIDPEKSFIQEKTFGDLRYQLKYESVEYKAVKELNDEGKPLDASLIEEREKEYDGLLYFVLRIENLASNKSPLKSIIRSYEDLAKVNQYCQSKLEKDIYAESGGVKVPCALFHLEEDHGLVNFNLLSFAFDTSLLDANKDFRVVFDDPMFNTGTMKFNFSKDYFNQLPKLKSF